MDSGSARAGCSRMFLHDSSPPPTQEMTAMSKRHFRDLFKARSGRRPPSRPRRSWGRFCLEPCADRTLLSLGLAPAVTSPVGSRPDCMVTADFNGAGTLHPDHL